MSFFLPWPYSKSFHFLSSDTFRVKKSPKRSPLSDAPPQVRGFKKLFLSTSFFEGTFNGTLINCTLINYILSQILQKKKEAAQMTRMEIIFPQLIL